jgi:Ser/Thr protein kinase RdoA (MazF antagonist)
MSGHATDLATVERVAYGFGISRPVDAIHPIGAGHINETFLVVTQSADYVVQRINRTVFADPDALMRNVTTVSNHLRGRFVPELVAARHGGWLVHDDSGIWRAWHRVGAETLHAATPDTARAAADLLGRFHLALADLDPGELGETLPYFHDPARRLARLREVVAADPAGRVRETRADIDAALASAPLADAATELVARVPRRVAHNDAKLDNVLFRAGEAVCLVDLDTVMPSAWFWDVGDLLRTASTLVSEDEPDAARAVVDVDLYRAVLAGYRDAVAPGIETGAVEATELDALDLAGRIVTYEQALRFLTDWLAGDLYYRTTRAGQNRDRARVQLSLLASMPGTVGG